MSISVVQQIKIANAVKELVSKSSQAKIANRASVSAATINHIVNDKWASINSDMFKAIEVNLKLNFSWRNAEVTNYRLLTALLNNLQINSRSAAVSERAGRGKTHTYRRYAQNYDNVIHIECANSWSKKSFVKHLMVAAGLSQLGTTEELIERFVKHLKTLHRPVVIIDQFDKLKDSQCDLFMDFYNALDGYCAFLLSGVKALEKRILNGVNRDKVGFDELYSRIGRKFIKLDPITRADVKKVCNANDITDTQIISFIYADSEGDLRRVKRNIEIEQQKAINALKELKVNDFQEVTA